MLDKINAIKTEISAGALTVSDSDRLQALESRLRRELKELFGLMKDLPPDQKKDAGKAINDFKTEVEAKIADARARLSQKSAYPFVDLSIKSNDFGRGKIHPLIRVGKMLEDVYKSMGFSIVYGPEIETDKYNYEMLNMPYYHPARDMQDTFYLDYPSVLLRSHTSCVQIRHMLKHKPPLMIISPGLVYRVDEIDPQHTPCFYQVEGLAVGEGVSLANLKWTLIESVKQIFGQNYKVRFSPCYYPYTEPSAAVDMSCIICEGAGCRTCKGTGWMRVGGAGMVHPNVFAAVGFPDDTIGFAFGWGLNKFPMIYYKIAEMRKLFENEIALWQQL